MDHFITVSPYVYRSEKVSYVAAIARENTAKNALPIIPFFNSYIYEHFSNEVDVNQETHLDVSITNKLFVFFATTALCFHVFIHVCMYVCMYVCI